MAGQSTINSKFSIDDAFQETLEDKIRIYGTTSETAPLHPDHDDSQDNSPDDVFISVPANNDRPILKNSHTNAQAIKATRLQEDSTSQDSASLIPDAGHGYYSGPSQEKFWWKHPKIKQNWKMVIASALLVMVGTGLIVTGIVAYALPSLKGIQGFVFFIAGIICMIPGAYHLVYIYLAVKGKRGFDFHHLPLFS